MPRFPSVLPIPAIQEIDARIRGGASVPAAMERDEALREARRHMGMQPCGYRSCAPPSICLRRLSGLMSVHTLPMYSRHTSLGPVLPTAVQPGGKTRSAGQIEYCSSWFMTTWYTILSSASDAISHLRIVALLKGLPARAPGP